MFDIIGSISKINDLRMNMRNWYVVPLFKLGLIKSTTFVTKRGDKVRIKNKNDYYTFFSGRAWGLQKLGPVFDRVAITENTVILDRTVKFSYHKEIELGATLLMLGEVYREEYGSLDVKGRVVIDIGANIADSTIYFALKGAKHVIAFEPFPATYRQAKENIKLNKLTDRVTLLNMGVSGSKTTIRLPATFIGTSGMDSIGKSALNETTITGIKIKVITLEMITKLIDVKEPVVKMDCEGCEYESILDATNDTLRYFTEFILEYHKDSKSLVKKFNSAGFTTELKGKILFAKRVD